MCSYLLTCCATSEDGIILFCFGFFDLAWPSFIAPNHVCILPRGAQVFMGVMFHRQKHMSCTCCV